MSRTDEQIRQRMARLRKRVLDECRTIGIDVERIPTDDAAVVQASAALRSVARLLRGGTKRAVKFHSEPTPERAAKTERMVLIEVNPGQPRAHATIWPPDQMRGSLTAEEHNAATRYATAYVTAMGKSRTVQFGVGGGGSGRGLEPAERQVEAGAVVRALERAVISTLGPAHMDCVRNFVLEQPMRPGDARPMTWVEFGRLHGNPGDDGAARWLARGALKAACAVLASALANYDQKQRVERRSA